MLAFADIFKETRKFSDFATPKSICRSLDKTGALGVDIQLVSGTCVLAIPRFVKNKTKKTPKKLS